MKDKLTLLILFITFSIFSNAATFSDEEESNTYEIYLHLSKQIYTSDEQIDFDYLVELPDDLQGRQWNIVLAEKGADVQKWLVNSGIGISVSGSGNFNKLKAGKYEVRILLLVPPDDFKGLYYERILLQTNFEVISSEKSDSPDIFIATSKEKFSNLEEIMVNYAVKLPVALEGRQWNIVVAEASSGIEKWLRLIPGQSLEPSGNISFINLDLGHYEARILLLIPPNKYKGSMYEKILAKVSFEVANIGKEKAKFTVKTTKHMFASGENIVFDYTVKLTGDLVNRQWGIVLAKASSGIQDKLNLLSVEHTNKAERRHFEGVESGNYEIRILLMIPPEQYKGKFIDRLLAKTSFTVE